MSKVISTTVVNPNGKEDTCAYAVVDSKELYYLLSLVTAPDKYTISFFIKSLANETLTLWYGEESKEFEVTTSWQKITWNFSAEWVDNVMLQFTEGEYYIYNTMLERGNVATDYSMSQYDQKKVLKDMENTLNTKYAQLSIALDDITLEVSETSSKLGNVESSVKLMSDEIGLKVNKNGIIGAINLSSEQAQIMASKIDLVGAVTLSSLSSDVASKFDTLDDITVTDNNVTYIDGGKIYTNSITANKLNIDDIFGNTAVLNKIVSQEIFTNAIETNTLIVGASDKANQALNSVNKTVKGITMHYLATTLGSGVTTSTSGWTTTVQQIDATKKYLWTYQTITYVDNTTTNTSPVISGVYGNEGVDGKGITSVTPLYYLKSNNTAPSAPTSAVTSTSTSSGVWTKSVPTYVANYTYFACTQTQYTNGTYGWSTVVADNALTNANKTATTANSTATTANNTANAIKNNIYKSGTTLIDGAKIYTGSITADKIDVDNLFAQDIEATGSISGVTIISQTDMARIINENGEIKFQYKDTRGEGNFIDIGSIYAASLGDIYATGTWTFDDIELSNGQNVYVLSAPRYPITSGSDLNDYTTAGTYIKASSSITVKNEPSGITAYKLIVDELVDGGSGTRNVRQKVKSTISNVEYMRTGYYRSFVLIWTDWEKVVTTSDLPKTKTIKYNLQNMSWTKSSNGMYYVYIDITDMDILTVSRGNWNGMKDTDLVQVGKLSSTRIVISANRNNFDVNSAIEVVFLYT